MYWKTLAAVLAIHLWAPGATADDQRDCRQFLCEYGNDPFKNPKLVERIRSQVREKLNFDLLGNSDVSYAKEVVEDSDTLRSEQYTANAITVTFKPKVDVTIKGHLIKKGSKIVMSLIGNDVELRLIESKSPINWGMGPDFPSTPVLMFCLWEPTHFYLKKGERYRGVEVLQGRPKFLFYRDHSIKEIRWVMGPTSVKVGDKVYSNFKSLYFKKDGSLYGDTELANQQKQKLKKSGEWVSFDLKEGSFNDICKETISEAPDETYKIKAEDNIGAQD